MTPDPADPPASRARAGWGLRARITALVVAVAALVALIGGLLSVQFVRTALEGQAREQLRTSLTALDDRGDLLVGDALADLVGAGILWAVVPADGSVRGPAARYIDEVMAETLRGGHPVSDTARVWRAPVVLEGVPVGGGGLVLATAEGQINTVTRQLVWRIATALAIGVLVAATAGAWFARQLSGPLTRTAAAADRIARGERGVTVSSGGTIPEVAAVTDALTALDRSLAASEGRQREFLLSISHELRTPLTAIRGYAEGLADGTFHGDAVIRAGEILQAETARLHRFVDDLLELARLEADDFTLDIHPTAPAELLLAVRDAWSATAARHTIAIEVRYDGASGDLRVDVDARRLRQIVDGVVENALRVAPSGSTLTLELTGGAEPALSVRDRGPGLTDEDLARAFDRGVLAARYRGTRPVGSGLGLSIGHRMAARLGLRIEAARPPSGPGTIMTIYLPPAVRVRPT
ncbi:HAMP domain-containing sensor histidine kinase [Microbacterium sp.]|uniref:sensor histidine kinase n=1 Tax=Microbacterium sp. TaxID=51671 RepID=UPI0025DAD91F|nr:HAMP domain-containing sensor histidine kinase [Microbacterium sp.]